MLLFVYLVIYAVLSLLLLSGALKVIKTVTKLNVQEPAANISVIIPIYGMNKYFKDCLQSWLSQKFDGNIQFIFSLQDYNDQSLSLLKSLQTSHTLDIIVNPVKKGFSGKGSNLFFGYEKAKFDNIVFADADIFIESHVLSQIVALVKNGQTLVSCLPVHRDTQNFWSSIYAYVWNVPLVCIWGPSMVSGHGSGVAGGVLAFKKELLEQVGGVKTFAGYLAEDLIFGSLVKKMGGSLVLGPKVFSPVDAMSFNKLVNNLKRAHLIGLMFNNKSKLASFVGMAFGYGYTLIPLIAFISNNLEWMFYWVYFVIIRFMFLTLFNVILEGKVKFHLSFLIGDPLNLVTFIVSVFNRKVAWGNKVHKIGPQAKILD